MHSRQSQKINSGGLEQRAAFASNRRRRAIDRSAVALEVQLRAQRASNSEPSIRRRRAQLPQRPLSFGSSSCAAWLWISSASTPSPRRLLMGLFRTLPRSYCRDKDASATSDGKLGEGFENPLAIELGESAVGGLLVAQACHGTLSLLSCAEDDQAGDQAADIRYAMKRLKMVVRDVRQKSRSCEYKSANALSACTTRRAWRACPRRNSRAPPGPAGPRPPRPP